MKLSSGMSNLRKINTVFWMAAKKDDTSQCHGMMQAMMISNREGDTFIPKVVNSNARYNTGVKYLFIWVNCELSFICPNTIKKFSP
jgi:hypothetical protein